MLHKLMVKKPIRTPVTQHREKWCKNYVKQLQHADNYYYKVKNTKHCVPMQYTSMKYFKYKSLDKIT